MSIFINSVFYLQHKKSKTGKYKYVLASKQNWKVNALISHMKWDAETFMVTI